MAGIAVPRLTAEVLLGHAMQRERVYLYAHPEQELSEVEWLHYGRYLHERLQRQAHAVHHRTPGVLRPRVPRHARRADPAARDRARGGSRAGVGARRAAGARCRHRLGRAGRHAATGNRAPRPGRPISRPPPPRWPRRTPPAGARACSFVVCDLMEAIAAGVHGPDRLQPALRAASAPRGLAARGARLGAARGAVRRRRPASNSTTASSPMPRACCAPAAG